MATITWQGPGGTPSKPKSGMWDTASNWNGGTVPGAADGAFLPGGGYIVTLGDGSDAVTASVGSLTIDATFEIAKLATLTVVTSLTNAGKLIALPGGKLTLGPGAVLTNNQSGTLTGGYFEADAGSTLSLTGGAITTTDHTNIYLNGAGSLIQAGDGVSYTPLEQSLTTIGHQGGLRINKSNYSTSNAISLSGVLVVSQSTFSSGLLTVSSSGAIEGNGTIASSINSNGEVTSALGQTIGTLTLSGAADVFSGQLLGDLVFTGGTVSLPNGEQFLDGATIAGAALSIGQNSQINSITLSSGSLILGTGVQLKAGTSTFNGGEIEGSGELISGGILSGTTVVGGKAHLETNGNLVQHGGDLILGDSSTSTAKLEIQASSLYLIEEADNITLGDSSQSVIINQGQIQKLLGSGASVITPRILNTGTILSDDALDIAGAVYGAGALQIGDSSTLEFDQFVAPTQALTFLDANDTLRLGDAHDFHASMTAFAGDDAIDLLGFSAVGAKLNYASNGDNTGGRLLVASGAMITDLVFNGQYTQASFHLATDNHGGTLLTLASG